MKTGLAARFALGAAGLGVAAAAGWAGWDAQMRVAAELEGGTALGGAAEIASVQADFARLAAAVGAAPGGARAALRLLPEFRQRLGKVIADASRAGALSPSEIERLAGLASGLDGRYADFGAAAIGDAEAMARIGEALAAESDALAALAAAARAREAEAAAALDAAAEDAAERALIAAGAAAALLALLVGGLSLGGRSDDAEGRIALAETRADLAEAQRGRARFVAMMSHELRTPMNGVLGLLALMKESSPSPAMLRLVEQAERAGLQLNGMLGDMLEIEASGGDRAAAAAPGAQLEAPPAFRLASLASAMRDLYAPVAARNGVDFAVSVSGGAPDRLGADGRRFQRALSHLCGHVLDRAGVKDVRLDLGHEAGECRAELSFQPPRGGAEALGLDEIAGVARAPDAAPAGNALGPLLAKGLVEGMGGRLEVTTLESGRVLILAAAPAEALPDDVRPRVRVIAQSASLGALGQAAADSAGVDVMSLDQAPDPDVVLVEPGGEEEARACAECRRRWPDALIAALGQPERPDRFDAVIAGPLAPKTVRAAVERLWESRDRMRLARADAPPARPAPPAGREAFTSARRGLV